jgi:hypothetical protein
MECPDIDKLIDLYHGRLVDAELERHVTDCPACWTDWKLLCCLPLVGDHELQVPEAWVQGVMARWAREEGAEEPTRATLGDGLLAAALGAVASGATLMAGGSMGMGPPALLVAFLVAPASLAWFVLPGGGVRSRDP